MYKQLLTTLIFCLSTGFLVAQVPPPPDYHENSGPGAPTALPVDQYIFFLFSTALIAGIYVIWQKKRIIN